MPQTQVAQVASYDFGAPAVVGTVLEFRARKGGKLDLKFEAENAAGPVTVTVQVSADGAVWADTTATDNGEAIVAVVVPPKQSREFTINLRETLDNRIRVQASGSARGQLQIRGTVDLESVTI